MAVDPIELLSQVPFMIALQETANCIHVQLAAGHSQPTSHSFRRHENAIGNRNRCLHGNSITIVIPRIKASIQIIQNVTEGGIVNSFEMLPN